MDSPTLPEDVSPVKLILVTGSVISGVGKGVISSCLGVLLKANGYRVSAIKIDPYLNVDAGTFSPFEHGEVFVLDDGGEVDLDLGNYERFLNVRLTRDNNITTGKIYSQVINMERQGKYLGKTVQTVPHVTDAIIDWVERVAQIPVDGTDQPPHVCIVELGGTIGDVEGMAYTTAFSENYRRRRYAQRLMNVHVTMLLDIKSSGETKTKPMQNGIQKLRATGLVPHLIMCRGERQLTKDIRKKIVNFSQLDHNMIIDVHDVSNIYKVPLLLESQNVLELIKEHLKLEEITRPLEIFPSMREWAEISENCEKHSEVLTIGLVGKYFRNDKIFSDAYASVVKALGHSALAVNRKLKIQYINSEHLEDDIENEFHSKAWENLRSCQGIVVPGGFGDRGINGMLKTCKYAREESIPFLGICLGMQCAAVEFARSKCGMENATSEEFGENNNGEENVIITMLEHCGKENGMGGTMRLGKRTTVFLTEKSILRKLYGGNPSVDERHRHRYEVNPVYVPKLSKAGFVFVGMGVDEINLSTSLKKITDSSAELARMAAQIDSENSEEILQRKIEELCIRGGDGIHATAVRMEMFELKDHPYFVGVQYHPEYLSHPLKPSPPFLGLALAASGQLLNHPLYSMNS